MHTHVHTYIHVHIYTYIYTHNMQIRTCVCIIYGVCVRDTERKYARLHVQVRKHIYEPFHLHATKKNKERKRAASIGVTGKKRVRCLKTTLQAKMWTRATCFMYTCLNIHALSKVCGDTFVYTYYAQTHLCTCIFICIRHCVCVHKLCRYVLMPALSSVSHIIVYTLVLYMHVSGPFSACCLHPSTDEVLRAVLHIGCLLSRPALVPCKRESFRADTRLRIDPRSPQYNHIILMVGCPCQ